MDAVFLKITEYDDQTTISGNHVSADGSYPADSTDFHRTEKSYPVSTDGNKYVVSGFTPFSGMQDVNIYANALLWTVKNVCPQLREGITEVNAPAKNFSCDLILASQADSNQKEYLLLQSPVSSKDGKLVYYLSNIRIESSAVIMKKNHSHGEAATGQESISQRNHG